MKGCRKFFSIWAKPPWSNFLKTLFSNTMEILFEIQFINSWGDSLADNKLTHRPQIRDSDTKEKETHCSASPYFAKPWRVTLAQLTTSLSVCWWPCWGVPTVTHHGGYGFVGDVEHNPWGCSPAPSESIQAGTENTREHLARCGSAEPRHWGWCDTRCTAWCTHSTWPSVCKLLLARPRSWCA